jgi:hypothetical protein
LLLNAALHGNPDGCGGWICGLLEMLGNRCLVIGTAVLAQLVFAF